ncbi:MEDS domain-containing protein [Actinoplanes palleronii]|uniref:MEDS domain-containing protein n=1 Tax=Actinoplanes palleronii TaxID=113570 RepID=UPI00194509D2|nr:MEDS domain-containing protein [Actinoplanes palleronii]
MTVDAIEDGDHVCLTYSDPDERLDLIADFVAAGLDRGHKVLCFTDSISPEKLTEELSWRGLAVARATATGQLAIAEGGRLWFANGSTSTSATDTLDTLTAEIALAREQGYDGLRVTADMWWATQPVAAVQELLAFESRAADLSTDGRLTAICQYDRDGFDPVTLAFAAEAHAKTVAAVAYHDDALLRICRQHRPPGIRIAGELDYTRLEPLQQALSEALRLDDDIHVNLGKLRFIDITTATVIAKAALSLPTDRHMIISCGGSVTETLRLVGADEAGQLRVQPAR